MKKVILIALLVFAFAGVASAAPLMEFEKGKVAIDYTFRPSLDFNAGGEIKWRLAETDETPYSDSISGSRNFDGDANLDLGLTFGIGNKWAMQYRQYNPSGTIWSGRVYDRSWTKGDGECKYNATVDLAFEGKLRSDEFNLMYSLNKNWAAFAGVVRSSASIKTTGSYNYSHTHDGEAYSYYTENAGITAPEIKSEDKNMFHFGVVGSYKVAPKTNLWGLASFGDDYRNWEAGLSYDIGKDLQLNISYRDTKWSQLGFGNGHYTETYGESGHTYSASAEINAKDITAKGWGFGITYKF